MSDEKAMRDALQVRRLVRRYVSRHRRGLDEAETVELARMFFDSVVAGVCSGGGLTAAFFVEFGLEADDVSKETVH